MHLLQSKQGVLQLEPKLGQPGTEIEVAGTTLDDMASAGRLHVLHGLGYMCCMDSVDLEYRSRGQPQHKCRKKSEGLSKRNQAHGKSNKENAK